MHRKLLEFSRNGTASSPSPVNAACMTMDITRPYVETFRSNEKRCVTFQRAHNNMFTHIARARCSDACPPAAPLVSLTALLMSLQVQLARPNPPSTFPTHVDWCMYASMSGSLVPTHTNDAPRHPSPHSTHAAPDVPTSPAGWYWPSPDAPPKG